MSNTIVKHIILESIVMTATLMAEPRGELPKPRQGGCYVIAHRGAHEGIPENSLPAFRRAIELGCDFVELDTRATKDGVVVSVHNSSIDAYVQGYTGKVKDFTLAELKQMDIGARVGEKWKGTRIPTVEEIFRVCSGNIGVYIDLKEPLVPEVTALLRKYHLQHRAVWYIPASRMEAILQVQKLCPESFVMPDPGPAKNIAAVTARVHPGVLATDMGELSETYVASAHENGAMVFVDDKAGTIEEWKRILTWETDGIQTDKPAELIEFLRRR